MKKAKCFYFDKISSTFDKAWDLLNKQHEYPFYVVAKTQSRGRGRYGNQWQSFKGNIHTTLLIQSQIEEPFIQALPFAVALAIRQALIEVLPEPLHKKCFIKWPNDIFIKDSKIAGLLIESKYIKGTSFTAIGIGINISKAPIIEGRETTYLNHYAPKTHHKDMFERLQKALAHYLFKWQNKQNALSLCSEWRSYAYPLIGKTVVIRQTHETFEGILESYTEYGALCLRMHDASHKIIATGDVFEHKKRKA